MTWFHGRWRREISLLAAGALDGGERQAAERHAASCEACAADLSALRAVLAVAAVDEACAAEPPVAVEWLRARVHARLDAGVAVADRRGCLCCRSRVPVSRRRRVARHAAARER